MLSNYWGAKMPDFFTGDKMYRLTLLSKFKCLAVLSGLLCASAWAAYPERTVTLVVPFTPGSGSDIIARIIAPKLSERWKQAVVVDNKPGASGNIGADAVAKAAPDGHTLLMAINTITMAPNMFKRVPFDPTTDFTPIMKMAVANFAIVVNPQIGAQDLAGVIALAKAKPGQINFGSPGNGTPHHLAMELMKQITWSDTRPTLHHYRDVSGNEVDFVFESPDGRIVGIEIRCASDIGKNDYRGLEDLASAVGKDFVRGVILYTGSQRLSFGKNLLALPMATLWQTKQRPL